MRTVSSCRTVFAAAARSTPHGSRASVSRKMASASCARPTGPRGDAAPSGRGAQTGPSGDQRNSSESVGSRPARIYGVNTIGLMRRGFPPDAIGKLKSTFRYLLQ